MALKPVHYSMLSLGVTAIGVVVAVWYYRNQQAAAASSAGAAAPTPLFQTAAIPGGGTAGDVSTGAATGSGTTASGSTSGAVTSTGISSSDLAKLASDQIQGNNATSSYATQVAGTNTFTALTAGLFSQMISQLPSTGAAGSNNLDLIVSSPLDSLHLAATYGASPGAWYQPPVGPTPLVYSSAQGTIASTMPAVVSNFVPLPTQGQPYISPPIVQAPDQGGGGSGAE